MPKQKSSRSRHRQLPDTLRRDICVVREMMLTVHYFEESSWLLAAVEFPALCASDLAQQSLRDAARIAWQFGFPSVTHWLNTEILAPVARAAAATASDDPDALPDPATEPV